MGKEKVEVVLPESAIDFLNYCRVNKGLSEDTITGYEMDLRIFINYIKLHRKQKNRNVKDIDIKRITAKDLAKYVVYLVDELENTERTIKRKTATLKSYFEYLQNFVELITINPTYGLKTPKEPKRQPIYLTLEESKMLLNSLDKGCENYIRDYCIITLFLNCGMRLSELANIKVDDIKEDALTIIGKGNKERTTYLNEVCLKALKDYIEYRNNNEINDEKLFTVNKEAIGKMIKRKLLKSEIKNADRFSCHKLRHTTATLLYKYGNVGIGELKELLGHESISTTQIYTHIDNEQIRDAVKKNPLNNLLVDNK